MAGGLIITLTGTGFEKGAAVYFGSTVADEVIYESDTTVKAKVPTANEPGSVPVTIVNTDGGMATLSEGFTYLTSSGGAGAQVVSVSPRAIIEGEETVVTLRGRNLIVAYKEGVLAFRGPSRAIVNISNISLTSDETTGLEEVSVTLAVYNNKPLKPLERVTIQILASARPDANNDLMVESSRQMFTVLPQGVPVPLAYTANLEPDKPNLVMFVGKNLQGCRLGVAEGITLHLESCTEQRVAGIVTLSEKMAGLLGTQIALFDKDDKEISQYSVTVGVDEEFAKINSLPEMPQPPLMEGAPRYVEDPPISPLKLSLIAVPEQEFVSPTQKDSTIFNLRGEEMAISSPLTFNFIFVLYEYDLVLELLHTVELIPMFDGGGSALNSPVLAQVGKLFPVRGVGLLTAIRVEVRIHIVVYAIVGIIIDIFPDIYFNEFPGIFPDALFTIVYDVVTVGFVYLIISWLEALVQPNGRLRVIFTFNLTLGFDFFLSFDGRHLHFDPDFTYRVHNSGLFPENNLSPCEGRFQLAQDNGISVFPDASGGSQSFYFPRAAGQCCVPWHFNLNLLRFSAGGPEETIQPGGPVSFCLNAAPSPGLINVVITSVPPPTGFPQRLEMNISETAQLTALAQPVDENGNVIGPFQDVRDLGYGVEFYLDPSNDLLDPTTLPPGDAFAIQAGNSVIRAAVTSVRIIEEGPIVTFWPGGVLGFDILRFLAEGQPPRVRTGGLPLQVNANQATTIRVEPVLAIGTTKIC